MGLHRRMSGNVFQKTDWIVIPRILVAVADYQAIGQKHSYVSSNNFTTVNDFGESLACIKTYPIPLADQSVLRKASFKLSYFNRIGEITR